MTAKLRVNDECIKPTSNKNEILAPKDCFSYLIENHSKSIDSTKIRIPLEEVKILNDILGDEYVVYSKRTGEEITDENFKRNSYFYEEKGCKTYYKIEQQIGKDGIVNSYLIILLTSKILGEKYFKGIHQNTILDVYDNIISQGIISLSFESFMNSECTDTDIKVDLVPRVKMIEIVDTVFSLAKSKKLAIEACSVYRKKSNMGIQFALRKTSKYIKSPYLKFYEKIRELKCNSVEFYSNYLSDFELPEELLRIETTIKNKKHFRHLGQFSTKLKDVIGNLYNVAMSAFKKAFEAHLDFSEKNLEGKFMVDEKATPEKYTVADLNEKDRVVYYSIKKDVDFGISFKNACEGVISNCCFTKESRYKMKKRINSIFNKLSIPVADNSVSLRMFKTVMDMVNNDPFLVNV